MKKAIGVKIVGYKPMTKEEFEFFTKQVHFDDSAPQTEGYLVTYPNAKGEFGDNCFRAWSPKDVFEHSYLGIDLLLDDEYLEEEIVSDEYEVLGSDPEDLLNCRVSTLTSLLDWCKNGVSSFWKGV